MNITERFRDLGLELIEKKQFKNKRIYELVDGSGTAVAGLIVFLDSDGFPGSIHPFGNGELSQLIYDYLYI